MQRDLVTFDISKTKDFKTRLFLHVCKYSPSVFLDSHPDIFADTDSSKSFQCIAASGKHSELKPELSDNLKNLQSYHSSKNDWLFGFITYDLKNELEELSSQNTDKLEFPVIHFFQPEFVYSITGNELKILYHREYHSEGKMEHIFNEICETPLPDSLPEYSLAIQPVMSKKEYLNAVVGLKKHIRRGDIYEANLCQEFFAENALIQPELAFLKLQKVSPAPFSAWYFSNEKYLLCSSPERFLKKEGARIFSQPIKGTSPRGKNRQEDELIKTRLENDPKERSENIMIVDLVRNDLSQTALKGTVKVEELCKVYTFPQVHQMISTISSVFNPEFHWTDILKTTFPMGSMTGAPKIRAMQLIEQFEKSKRGLYSGSVGYVTPEGNFDFNVVIRSILFNSEKKYLSYQVGGAITWASDPEKEYKECLLKSKGMLRVLNPAMLDSYSL
jgi:para-aminobenzoate synthetase component I